MKNEDLLECLTKENTHGYKSSVKAYSSDQLSVFACKFPPTERVTGVLSRSKCDGLIVSCCPAVRV